MYCGLSTASEVFLYFTAQLQSCLCKYNVFVFIYRQQGVVDCHQLLQPSCDDLSVYWYQLPFVTNFSGKLVIKSVKC